MAEKSKLFCANMLMKSIEEIKLQHEIQNKAYLNQNKNSNNHVNKHKNNLDFNGFNQALRSNLLKHYYENNERINETLAENNSEN